MKIRRSNIRSLKAIIKLPYVINGNTLYPDVFQYINEDEDVYDLFLISKDHYAAYQQFTHPIDIGETTDDEDVS
jgi:hypothetical protein